MRFKKWTQMQKTAMISNPSQRLKKFKRQAIRHLIMQVKMIMKSSPTFTIRESQLRSLMAKRVIIAQTLKYISNT